MRFILKSEQTQKTVEAEFPATGKELQDICDKLDIENNSKTQVTVGAVNYVYHSLSEDEDRIFLGKTFVLDEMNFLAKQLSDMTTEEVEVFGEVVSEFDYSMQEMIELTVNTHNMEIAYNEPDLVAVASKLYLEQNFKLSPEDVDFTQEEASKFLCDYSNGQASKMTRDGKLIYQTEAFEPFFTGSCLPQSSYDGGPVAVDLWVNSNSQGNKCETIYLPYHETELQKSLERLGITEESQLKKVELKIFDCDLDQRLEDFLKKQPMTFENLSLMNRIAGSLGEMYEVNSKELAKFMEVGKISTLEELAVVSENMEFLTFIQGIDNPREYAELLLDDVVGIDYHMDSSDYIDYDGFGRAKLERIDHAFRSNGLLMYQGSNQEMIEIMQDIEEQNLEMGGMQ